ncbi:MAG: hypothetical protein HeimC3_05790 [Candidatus Heimdallarchaeota archaeon LC_3]|nr:MAG: hypothetical protein HeimC3_05790 [Candidatus Heimdallarchaeota archaeon LC_3]
MKNIYLSLLIAGVVFAFLSLLTGMGVETSITILFFTFYGLSFLRLIEEWRFFSNYDAPPASSLFLALITVLALSASFTSRLAEIGEEPLIRQTLISLFIDIELLEIFPAVIYLNLFSLLFASIWYIFLFILMKRYHSGRYPGIFVNRRLFPRIIIIFVNLAIIVVIGLIWGQTGSIELFELLWIFATIILLLQYYVFKVTLVPVRIVSIPFRTSRSREKSRTSGSSSSSYSSPLQPRLILPSNQSSTNRSPSPLRANSSSVLRSSNLQSTSTIRQSPRGNRTPSSTIAVLPGRDIGSRDKKSKISASHLPLLLPKAKNLSQDDFRCIFCYELPVENNKYVIICSNCHKPSHEDEYLQWKANSDICSYCNTRTSTGKQIRLSGKNYNKVIKLALKK